MDPISNIYTQLLAESNIFNADDVIKMRADGSVALDYMNGYITLENTIDVRIRKWFVTQYRKWFLNNDDEGKLSHYTIQADSPQWARDAVENGDDLWYKYLVEADENLVYNILDWLESLDDRGLNKLQRMTVQQVRQKMHEWHQSLQKKATKKEDWENLEVVQEFPNGFKMVEIKSDAGKEREGGLMGHCVGGGGYANSVIFSLRDSKNNPHVTIQADFDKDSLLQIKGKSNEAPVDKYIPYVKQFIIDGNFKVNTVDGHYLGMVFFNREWYFTDSKKWDDIYESEIVPRQELRLKELKHIIGSSKEYVGNLDLSGLFFKELPDLTDVFVAGSVNIQNNMLTSLKGVPKRIGGKFFCNRNKLTSLEHAPEQLLGINFEYNNVTSLKGLENTKFGLISWSDGYINALHNPLTSLEGSPVAELGSFMSDQFTNKDFILFQRARDKGQSFKEFWDKQVKI
tara:strand:+ start:6844 stop:8214 length:1371 start_codon:yes stop_codon:yes gene_type:complete